MVIAAWEDSLGPFLDPPFVAGVLDQRTVCMFHAGAMARSSGESCTKISPAGSSLRIWEIAAALALKFAVVRHSVLLPAHSFRNRSRGFATGANGGSLVLRAWADAGDARAVLMRSRILARLGLSV